MWGIVGLRLECPAATSRGVLHMENGSFGIEPLESSTGFQHLVYRLEDVRSEPLKCGTPHTETDRTHSHEHEPHAVPVSHLLRVSDRDPLSHPQTRIQACHTAPIGQLKRRPKVAMARILVYY